MNKAFIKNKENWFGLAILGVSIFTILFQFISVAVATGISGEWKYPQLLYITIQSNLFVMLWYLNWFIGNVWNIESLKKISRSTGLKVGMLTCIVLTGVAYTGILLPFAIMKGTLDSAEKIIATMFTHMITPLLVAIHYFTSKHEYKPSYKWMGLYIVYPLVYVAVTMTLGIYLAKNGIKVAFPYGIMDYRTMGKLGASGVIIGIIALYTAIQPILIKFCKVEGVEYT